MGESTVSVFIVYDKTDQGYRKPFDSIHQTKESAQKRVKELQSKYESYAHGLIYFTVQALS